MAFLSSKLPWDLAQTKWSGTINPFLGKEIVNGLLLDPVKFAATTAQPVNHLLQRMPQGWIVVGNTANAVIWTTKPFTTTTITFEASAATTVTFWVF